MSAINSISFEDLLFSGKYNKSEIDQDAVKSFIVNTANFFSAGIPFHGATQIVDYTKAKHVALSDGYNDFLGYRPEEIMENGLSFIIEELFYNNDFEVVNKKIFPTIFKFLKSYPREQHQEFIITFSYRGIRKDGKIISCCQQGSFLTNPVTSLPLYGMGVVMDVSPFKKDSSIQLLIERRIDLGHKIHYETCLEMYFNPDLDKPLLTKMEMLIVKCLADGLSSKQIASKYFISEFTVVKHRKNILKKTNTKNSVELINFLVTNHLI